MLVGAEEVVTVFGQGAETSTSITIPDSVMAALDTIDPFGELTGQGPTLTEEELSQALIASASESEARDEADQALAQAQAQVAAEQAGATGATTTTQAVTVATTEDGKKKTLVQVQVVDYQEK